MITDEQKEIITKELHEIRLAKILHHLFYLEGRFPNTFCEKKPRPLKIGIGKELRKLGEETEDSELTVKKISKTLHYYTHLPQYIECCKEGGQRVDLTGVEVDTVTKEQANYLKEVRSQIPPIVISIRKLQKAYNWTPEELILAKEKKEQLQKDLEKQKRKILNKERKKKKNKRKMSATNMGHLTKLNKSDDDHCNAQ